MTAGSVDLDEHFVTTRRQDSVSHADAANGDRWVDMRRENRGHSFHRAGINHTKCALTGFLRRLKDTAHANGPGQQILVTEPFDNLQGARYNGPYGRRDRRRALHLDADCDSPRVWRLRSAVHRGRPAAPASVLCRKLPQSAKTPMPS